MIGIGEHKVVHIAVFIFIDILVVFEIELVHLFANGPAIARSANLFDDAAGVVVAPVANDGVLCETGIWCDGISILDLFRRICWRCGVKHIGKKINGGDSGQNDANDQRNSC